MDDLPDDVLKKIIDLSFICKKEQNFFINKRMLNLSKKKLDNCKSIIVFKRNICANCHKDVLKYFNAFYLY